MTQEQTQTSESLLVVKLKFLKSRSPSSLAPLYFSAQVLWVLIGFSAVGVFLSFCRVYLNVDLVQEVCSALGLF